MRMSSNGQVVELQSIRGLAALAVAVHHASYVFDVPPSIRVVIDLVLNAHAAIVLFFVLSGYVLTLSLMRSGMSAAALSTFFIRRVFRIYPALIVATVVALIVGLSISSAPGIDGLSPWGVAIISVAVFSPLAIGASFLGWPLLLPPAYTIVIEMIGSAALPIMVAFMRRGYLSAFLLVSLLGALSFFFHQVGGRVIWLMFLVDFALGALVALYQEKLSRIIQKRAAKFVAVCVVGLIFSRGIWMLLSTSSLQMLTFAYHSPTPALLEGLFSAGLIAAVVATPYGISVLRSKRLVSLGDISYGLYLVHLPIVLASAAIGAHIFVSTDAWFARTIFTVTVSIAVSILAASLIFRAVEVPGIIAGKKLVLLRDAARAQRAAL